MEKESIYACLSPNSISLYVRAGCRVARNCIYWAHIQGAVFMYEHRNEPLLSHWAFLRRMASHGGFALVLVLISLGIGMLGYHLLEGLSWLDALVNASMLLGGMGPVNALHSDAGKLFASFYALYSGLIFLVIAGVLLAPVLHRILHHFHLEEAEEADPDAA